MRRRRSTQDRRMVHIWLNEATRKRLRLQAAEEDVTVQGLVEGWIEDALWNRKKRT